MKVRTTQSFSFSDETMRRLQKLLDKTRTDDKLAARVGIPEESSIITPPPVKPDKFGLIPEDYIELQKLTGRTETGSHLLRVIMQPPTSPFMMHRVQQFLTAAQRTNKRRTKLDERRAAAPPRRRVNMSRLIEALVLHNMQQIEGWKGEGTKSAAGSRSNADKVA